MRTDRQRRPARAAASETVQVTYTDGTTPTPIPVDSPGTAASITLPATVNNGSIGIFAISAG